MSIKVSNQRAIVLLGDSITEQSWCGQGMATQLSQKFARRLDVINRGFSGYTTSMAMPIAKDILSDSTEGPMKIAFMTLWYGANDACLSSSPSRQFVPLSLYLSNLRAILSLLPPTTPKFLLTPPVPQPLRWVQSKGSDQPDRSEERTGEFAEGVRELARDMEGDGVVLVDVWKAFDEYRSQDGQSLDDLLSDGLHLTEKGYQLVNSILLPLVEKLGLENEPFTWPDWKGVLDAK